MAPEPISQTHELIAEGRALVRSLALRIYRNVPIRVDLDDLIAYGELGLVEAAQEFQAELGNKFSTFAYYRIRGAIYDGLAKMTWTSRARYRRMRFESMAAEALATEQQQKSNASDPQDNGKWFARVTERLAMIYLVCDGDEEKNLLETADSQPAAPKAFMHREASDKLRNLVDQLPENERKLIQLVYFDGYTLQEAGRMLGYSKSWASRMHAKVLEELADAMRRHDLHD